MMLQHEGMGFPMAGGSLMQRMMGGGAVGGFSDMDQMMGMNMHGMGGGGGMVMMSSSFSSDGRTVHQSSSTARMGPGGVAEVQSQVRDGSGRERIMMERRVGDRYQPASAVVHLPAPTPSANSKSPPIKSM
jgi:hypothetical protein